MWLMKSEPETWSWAQMIESQTTRWDGVRNYQANKHMKAMKLGDPCFFYHSGKERLIVGLVEVIHIYYPDPADPRFGMVDVKAVKPLPNPINLAAIKADTRLQQLALVRQSRLSVMPIDSTSWAILSQMGGLS